MTSAYDFGKDEMGKLLNEHVRIERPYKNAFVIVPHDEKDKGQKSAAAQVRLCANAIRRMAANGDVRTAMWDGITSTARCVINQIAREKVNRDDSSKHFTLTLGEGSFLNLPGINWRDNGMAQNAMKSEIRDALLYAPEDFNLFIIGHSVVNDKEGCVGMDIGGPAGAPLFPGGKFDSFFYLASKGDKRALFTKPTPLANGFVPTVTYKVRPGTKVGIADDGGLIPIPDDSYEASVDVWRELWALQGSQNFRCGLFGDTNAGKTTLASAFVGLDNTAPTVVVMADNQRDLPTWWEQSLGGKL